MIPSDINPPDDWQKCEDMWNGIYPTTEGEDNDE